MENKDFNSNPINLDKDKDRVGNLIYVDILENKIKESFENKGIETIALYGDWGIGKSSIINTVKDRLETKKIVFKEYGAWKYSSDDFRKSFLINLNKEYDKKIYTRINKTEYKFNYSNIVKCLIVTACVFPLLVAIISIFIDKNRDIVKAIINGATAVFMEYILGGLIKTLFIENVYIKQELFSPESFSREFKKTMDKNYKNKKVVFIIDDLDRCKYENVLEILECIQGFMKNKDDNNSNYLFIIPIDKNRLRNALKEKRSYSNREQDKYLDKMFDASVIVDSAGINNLYNMTKEIAEEMEIDLLPKSVELLSNYYIETPRDVNKTLMKIQNELNIQATKYNNNYSSTELSEIEIIKFFILRNKWPDIYRTLLNTTNVLKLDNVLEELTKSNSLFSDNNDHSTYIQFVNVSSDISIVNINYYHYLKSNDIYFDSELSSLYLSGKLNSIEINNYEQNQLISTFSKIYAEKRINSEVMNIYIGNLMKSYIWLLTKVDSAHLLFDSVFPNDICSCYCKYLNNFSEETQMITYVNKITDVFGVLLNKATDEIRLFINIFIEKIISIDNNFDVIYISLLNEKTKSILSSINFKKCLIATLNNHNIDDEKFSFIFDDLEKYKHILSAELWISLLNRKSYSFLIKLSEIDDMKYGDKINSILDSMNLIGKSHFVNYNSMTKDEITIFNNEIKIVNNLIDKPNQYIQSFITNQFTNQRIDVFITKYYNSFPLWSGLTEGLSRFIVEYDESYGKENHKLLYEAIHNYATYSNLQYIPFISAILKNIQNKDLKFESFVLALGVTFFNKDLLNLFIEEVNIKDNNKYIEFIQKMENAQSDYKYTLKYYSYDNTRLSKQSYNNNLHPLLINLTIDSYQEVVPCLPLTDILKNTNYINNLDKTSSLAINSIFTRISSLEDLLIINKAPNFKNKRSLIDNKFEEILSLKKDIYKDNPILESFTTSKEKEIIKKYYIE